MVKRENNNKIAKGIKKSIRIKPNLHDVNIKDEDKWISLEEKHAMSERRNDE